MEITIYDDGSIFEGKIVSYKLQWRQNRPIDLSKVRELEFSRDVERGAIRLRDGTQLELFAKPYPFFRKRRLTLKGYIEVHIESLNSDIRFNVQHIERLSFERKREAVDQPRQEHTRLPKPSVETVPNQERPLNGKAAGHASPVKAKPLTV